MARLRVGCVVLCIGLLRSTLRLGIAIIREGHAFVCDLDADQMREYRGTLTEPGKNSLIAIDRLTRIWTSLNA